MSTYQKLLEIGREHETERIQHPYMQYYRHVFSDSKRWDGQESLDGKRIIVYMEQGYGDCIQFLRYVPILRKRGSCTVYVYCRKELEQLFTESTLGFDHFIDKDDPTLPEHDLHVLSMTLPFYLAKELSALDASHTAFPYIKLKPFELDIPKGVLNIGICWEGSPTNAENYYKSIPLLYFRRLQEKLMSEKKIQVALYSLQPSFHNGSLIKGCEDMELFSTELNDFLDTARLASKMDCVVTVDTSTFHLCGAMNLPFLYLMLGPRNDGRFGDKDTTKWYRSARIIHKTEEDPLRWQGAFDELYETIVNKGCYSTFCSKCSSRSSRS